MHKNEQQSSSHFIGFCEILGAVRSECKYRVDSPMSDHQTARQNQNIKIATIAIKNDAGLRYLGLTGTN
jgi:hypothetical protein